MKINTPLVSFIVTAFNEEFNIEAAVYSCLNQTYKNFEIIVVDDGSTDKTLSVLESIKSEKLFVLKNHRNLGFTESLKKAIEFSRGEFIARLDADDINSPYRLEEQMRYFFNNNQLALVGSWALTVNTYSGDVIITRMPVSYSEIKRNIGRENPFIHSTVIFKKKFYLETEGFVFSNGLEDYKLWLQFVKKHICVNSPLVLINRYENNNFRTRPLYSNIKLKEFFKAKLRIQIEAFETYPSFTSFFGILRTIILYLKS
jgi:glycosyltransferase involved in cell wall biosynthesis